MCPCQNVWRKLCRNYIIFSNNKKHQPQKHVAPIFGQQQQFIAPIDDTPFLSDKEARYIHSIVGFFLYYARAVDRTILPTINELGLT